LSVKVKNRFKLDTFERRKIYLLAGFAVVICAAPTCQKILRMIDLIAYGANLLTPTHKGFIILRNISARQCLIYEVVAQ